MRFQVRRQRLAHDVGNRAVFRHGLLHQSEVSRLIHADWRNLENQFFVHISHACTNDVCGRPVQPALSVMTKDEIEALRQLGLLVDEEWPETVPMLHFLWGEPPDETWEVLE
jgi:hypothetical protein